MIVMGEYVLIKWRYNKAFNKGSVLFPIDVFRINKEFRILAITFWVQDVFGSLEYVIANDVV
jgi:hypothetical protein